MPLKIMLRDDITLMTKFQFQCFVYEVTMTLESHSGSLNLFELRSKLDIAPFVKIYFPSNSENTLA